MMYLAYTDNYVILSVLCYFILYVRDVIVESSSRGSREKKCIKCQSQSLDLEYF